MRFQSRTDLGAYLFDEVSRGMRFGPIEQILTVVMCARVAEYMWETGEAPDRDTLARLMGDADGC